MTENYRLTQVPIFDELNMTCNQVVDEKVSGMDEKYTWFESVPNSINEKKDVIVVSPEWQEKDINLFGCDGLGGDGVMNLVKDLQEKYPQIDPSRIYLTGLSIGGAESFLYLCGDHDLFQMIPVDGSSKYGSAFLFGIQIGDEDENSYIFSSLQAYERINGLKVSEMDMSKNEYYGIALDNQGWYKLGGKDMYTGTLSNENGVVMELAAIKDLAHYNYKPEAEYIWNSFHGYRRNVETIFNSK